MDYSLAIPAFIAGLITFLAPCTLPLVPAYLGFISGVSIEDLGDPEKIKKVRGKIFLNGLFFVIGFSAIFVMFGVAAGLIGTLFGAYRIWLARLGGIFVIIFGLFMLNVVKLPFLSKEVKVRIPSIFKKGKILNSFILGTVFGFGWTPCVGPILGSVLLLASSSATAFQGALMLLIFSAGLAIPFLLIAWASAWFLARLRKVTKFLNIISFIGGLFLILLGSLLLTNKFGVWVGFFYNFFDFLDYSRIYEYL